MPDERDELPLERLTPEERDELPVERLVPDERDDDPVDERPTPEEREVLPVERPTLEDRVRVLVDRPVEAPVRVVRVGTARLPVVELVRVVARLPEEAPDEREPMAERVVRVVVRVLPTLVRVVLVLPTVVLAERSPVSVPRDGRVPVASPLEAVEPDRPVLTTVLSLMALRLPSELRFPAMPSRSRPPLVPRVRLVNAERAIVSPRGA